MSAKLRLALFSVGVLFLVATPAAWYLSQPSTTAGELPPEFLAGEPDASDATTFAGTGSRTVTDVDATDSDGPTEPVVSSGALIRGSSITVEPRARPAPPVRLSIPAIRVNGAEVVDVGLDASGAIDIPEDVRQVGWYRRGPRPGEPGNAFMTSHIDSRTQGRGVLFDLSRLQPGDRISVTHEDGAVTEWEVAFRERIVKGSYPFERVFRFDGPPGLVIDTCGGAFDRATRNYENIDIVYAVPLETA